jgi:transcriptional regulator with XRE-family HTH domain
MGTMRQRRLGRELRGLRESAGLSQQQAIGRLGWSRAKLDRIESGVTTPKEVDLGAALDLYGADSDQRARLMQLRRDARQRGWWTAYNDVFSGSYIPLESEATFLRTWQTDLIPGLLQTEDYAREVVSAIRGDGDESIERRVQARMARRTLLGGDKAPRFHAILSEAVLRQEVGGARVMSRQLSYLWDAARRPNITIQVMPFEAGAHPGMEGSFVLLGFEDEADQDIPYMEGPGGDLYLEAADQTARINLIWDRIRSKALTSDQSSAMLAELAKEQ